MIVEEYSGEDTEDCLSIFDGNVGKYFADSEREEFFYSLSNLSQSDNYYTFNSGDSIVACGGYSKKSDYVLLT